MKCLQEEFVPRLREAGYKGSKPNFRRATSDVINCVNIQGNKYGGSCAVNLGLHFAFLPVNWGDHLPDVKKVKEVDCEFRKRLAPKGQADYWWKFRRILSSPAKNARHLIDTFFKFGEPWFERYSTVGDVVEAISLDAVRTGRYLEVLGGVTIQRAALTMARIHRHLDDNEMAVEFANTGLANIGSATALKPLFEELIEAT